MAQSFPPPKRLVFGAALIRPRAASPVAWTLYHRRCFDGAVQPGILHRIGHLVGSDACRPRHVGGGKRPSRATGDADHLRYGRQSGRSAADQRHPSPYRSCIYASPANLTFAEQIVDMAAKVCLPTTMNASSVDRANWQVQGGPPSFGLPAAHLAEAYGRMGCRPSFTCSPYLLNTAPALGENIAWAESNAVIFANTVFGARTAKHPDFLDLCIALTGRAPLSGVYLDAPP